MPRLEASRVRAGLQTCHSTHGRIRFHRPPLLSHCSIRQYSSTVDPSELTHFDALASSWWDPHGPSRLLHLMNPIRHQFLQSCLSSTSTATSTEIKTASSSNSSSSKTGRTSAELHLLDVGCGGGIFAESAARLTNVASVTAIDPSSEVLKVAQAHAKRDLLVQPKLHYINTTVEELASRPGGYDVVSLFEVIEHVPHPASFLRSLCRHVKPGGWIVLSTIARTWTSWFVTNLVAEDILGLVPPGTHDWNKYINEPEIRHWFVDKMRWVRPRSMGVLYIPGLGWKEVAGGEQFGNYFFAIQRPPL